MTRGHTGDDAVFRDPSDIVVRARPDNPAPAHDVAAAVGDFGFEGGSATSGNFDGLGRYIDRRNGNWLVRVRDTACAA